MTRRTDRDHQVRRGYRTPTRRQDLLLKAALLQGPAAVAAWEQWKLHVDTEPLDEDSHRLLPLLYRALHARGLSSPEMGRLEGVYRRTWYENSLRFHAAVRVLQALHDAGIKTMLLKGAALILRHYRDYGLRPMADFDILVPTHQASAAIEVLKTLGYAPVFESVGITEAEALATGHAYPFRNADGQELDLHWHVFYQRVDRVTDAELWASALPVTLHGVPTRTLSAGDQLLHVCVHGTQRAWWGGERAPNLRWVADAMMILRSAPEDLNWNRILAQAQRLQFVLPLREALGYLSTILDAPVPADVLRRIHRMPVSLGERIADRARSRPARFWGPWVALGVRYLEYSSNLPADAGLLRRLAGFPTYLQRRWGQVPLWHLPFTTVFRGLRRIRWAVEGHWRRGAST